MTTPDCPHDWSRSLSDPFTPRCRDCRVPFDPDVHDPPAEREPVDHLARLIALYFPATIVAPDRTDAA